MLRQQLRYLEDPSMGDEIKKGYVCSIAWDNEVGHTPVEVFETVERLQQRMGCSRDSAKLGCGIYEIEMRVSSVVRDQPRWTTED
jgi:hypothetical protein